MLTCWGWEMLIHPLPSSPVPHKHCKVPQKGLEQPQEAVKALQV